MHGGKKVQAGRVRAGGGERPARTGVASNARSTYADTVSSSSSATNTSLSCAARDRPSGCGMRRACARGSACTTRRRLMRCVRRITTGCTDARGCEEGGGRRGREGGLSPPARLRSTIFAKGRVLQFARLRASVCKGDLLTLTMVRYGQGRGIPTRHPARTVDHPTLYMYVWTPPHSSLRQTHARPDTQT